MIGCAPISEADYRKSHYNFTRSLELNNLGLLKEATDHAREVSPQYMNSVHPELKTKWGTEVGKPNYLKYEFGQPLVYDINLSDLV